MPTSVPLDPARLARRLGALALAAVVGPLALEGQTAPPILVQSSRTDVVLSVPGIRDAATDQRQMAMLVRGCRRSITVAQADSAAAVNVVPEPFAESAADGRTVVVLSVLATEGLQVNCGDRATQSALAAARGLRITLDTSYVRDRDIVRVVVRRGDQELTPLGVRMQLVRRLGANGMGPARAHSLRLAFSADQLAPGSDGVADDIIVEAWALSDSLPDRFALPWSALRATWESLLTERASSRGDGTGRAPLALPEPADAGLRAAHQAYASGQLSRAVQLAMPRLAAPGLDRADAREGRVQAGLALLALGDTAAARVSLGRALDDDPCLTLRADAPAELRAVMDALRRPPARCTSQSLLLTTALSAALPGFGRPTRGYAFMGRAFVASAVVGTAVYAMSSRTAARATYEDYVLVRADQYVGLEHVNAEKLYDEAESRRKTSKTMWTASAVIWGGQIVQSVIAERLHARALREVQGYGATAAGRSVGLAALVRPTEAGVGLGLTISW